MSRIGVKILDIDQMPRGGPDASWLDRRLQTSRPEYLDGDDEELIRRVVRSLDRLGLHKRTARLVLAEVADVPDPAILELGAGHGKLSRLMLEMRPTATVTVTDLNPSSVAAIADGDLGRHPRAEVRVADATAIDAADKTYDLAVFVQSLHHLPPRQAAQVFAEGTRVANKLLIIDVRRLPSVALLAQLPLALPLAAVFPYIHDGFISSLRAYSPSALCALAAHADTHIDVRRGRIWDPQIAVVSR